MASVKIWGFFFSFFTSYKRLHLSINNALVIEREGRR